MKRVIAGLATLLILLGAATALADRFNGESSDGTKVRLKTNKTDKPTAIRFGEYRAKCDRGFNRVLNPIGGFEPPFDKVTRSLVLDRGEDTGRDPIGESGTAKTTTEWRFVAHHKKGNRWDGRYRVSVLYERHGETLTRCATRFSFELKHR